MFRRLLICAAPIVASPSARAQGDEAAVFGTHLIGTSIERHIEGVRDDQTKRLAKIEARPVGAFHEQGCEIVSTGPVAAELATNSNVAPCNGCNGVIAAKLGADIAVAGEVQKRSNLIPTINGIIRAAGGGNTVLKVGNPDIRSTTDQTLRRGLNFLLKNQICKT